MGLARAGLGACLPLPSRSEPPQAIDFGMTLRQESLGKEKEPRTRKPFVGTLRVSIPPGRAGPAARSESCEGRDDSHREASTARPEAVGRAPKTQVAGSLRCGQKRGPRRPRYIWSHRTRSVLPGLESTGNDHLGSPGIWETPSSPPQSPAREPNHQLPGAPGGASATEGSKHPTQRRYRQAKATKRGERGGGESESLIVSLKRGNRPSWTLWREGETTLWARHLETCEGIGPPQRVTVRVSKPPEGRYPSVTSRVREIRQQGSVGARGEQSPSATRPFQPLWPPPLGLPGSALLLLDAHSVFLDFH